MQVQPVEPEVRDDVDEPLDVVDAEEVPRDVEHHAAPLEARLLLGHALTAPAVSPNEIFRCTSRKKTTTGIAISVEPAISAPQSVCLLDPRKYDSHTVTVCFAWSLSRTRAKMYSFQHRDEREHRRRDEAGRDRAATGCA